MAVCETVATCVQVSPPPDRVTASGIAGVVFEFVTTARYSLFAVAVRLAVVVKLAASVPDASAIF